MSFGKPCERIAVSALADEMALETRSRGWLLARGIELSKSQDWGVTVPMKTRDHIIDPIMFGRASLFELLIVGLVLAFGVNLVSDSLPLLVDLSPLSSLLVGLVFCIASAGYLIVRFLGKREQVREYKAFFVYDKKQNCIVNVPRYDLDEKLAKYLKAAFVENEAMKVIWDKEPLRDMWNDLDADEGERTRLRSQQMVSELVEYYILEKLSTHLSGYFAHGAFAQANLREYGRKDIPDVLLSNRFLELFSRPMEDRPHFIQETFGGHSDDEVVVLSDSEQGALFQRFDLTLPRQSSLLRPGPHTIEIRTDRMTILIHASFDGYSSVLPEGFIEAYLGISGLDGFLNLSVFSVGVSIKVVFKFGAWLSGAAWEYYRWIDSFLDELDDSLSREGFFSRLGWENAYTAYMLGGPRRGGTGPAAE